MYWRGTWVAQLVDHLTQFRLRSGSRGHEIEPCTGLSSACSLLGILSLSLHPSTCLLAHFLSLTQINKIFNENKNNVYWSNHHYLKWDLKFMFCSISYSFSQTDINAALIISDYRGDILMKSIHPLDLRYASTFIVL